MTKGLASDASEDCCTAGKNVRVNGAIVQDGHEWKKKSE